MTTYQDAGVHLGLGDLASQILYEAARKTWKNREGKIGEVLVPFDDFSGLRAIDVSSLPRGTLLNINFDGIGTKIEIAERMNKHDTIAHDLFAMVCDDAVIRGAEPVLLGSILDVNSLQNKKEEYITKIHELAKGYVEAAELSGVAVINGEIAELGRRMGELGAFRYNWGASLLWFARQDRLIIGDKIKEGDLIIALKEDGFRSNGFSLLREVLERFHGQDWYFETFQKTTFGKMALQPSRIYTKAVLDMTGGLQGKANVDLHGAVHITGGGIPSKLGRLLKKNKVGAILNDLFEPNPLMLYMQEKADISDKEAYRTWNMGQGMLLIVRESEEVLSIANNHHIGRIIGRISKKSGIQIKSKGFFERDKMLMFND